MRKITIITISLCVAVDVFLSFSDDENKFSSILIFIIVFVTLVDIVQSVFFKKTARSDVFSDGLILGERSKRKRKK